MEKDYERQHRGDRGAYERYLNGMDSSMRQKVALTAAHILSQGRIADMGMGSGTGSEALAALYPALSVIGVDVNPEMTALAAERYKLPNLSFQTGDIAEPVFPDESLDGILNSSVLHHVTTFNGYDPGQARRALHNQARQLAEGGVLIVRDFLDPGSREIFLDLPANDGATAADADADDLRTLSTAALFEKFAQEFRPLSDAPGFELARETENRAELREGFSRYRVSLKLATEFILRKDYREDWATEILEEYAYFTQSQFEQVFADLRLRPLASTPIRNPWIVRNRFENHCEIRALSGEQLEFPATNYLIVGEKVGSDEGVRFEELGPTDPIGFLQMERYQDLRDGKILDLVRRPGRTLDVIPWFFAEDDCFILARKSYPRPITAHLAARGVQTLDERRICGYVSEPIVVIQDDGPVGSAVESALQRIAGIQSDDVLGFHEGSAYYPSPGGVEEEVQSVLVQTRANFTTHTAGNESGFSTAGRIRAMEVRQLLRAAQVGGLPDARLELNAYQLLRMLKRSAGPWIGETIQRMPVGDASGSHGRRVVTIEELLAGPRRRVFRKAEPGARGNFLELRAAQFGEYNAAGKLLASQIREFVTPAPLSLFTLSTAILSFAGNRILLGIDDSDLPAAQAFNGNSNLPVTPAWRAPHSVQSLTPAREWLRGRLLAEYGLETGDMWELGGPYLPSPGLTPEVVYCIAVEVRAQRRGLRELVWLDLADFAANFTELRDGHLRIAGLRAAHALGLL